MSINAAALRNILAIMRNLDRDELPAMTDMAWERFRDDPYRGFLHLPDKEQDQVAATVSRRITPPDTRTQDEKDYEFDRLL